MGKFQDLTGKVFDELTVISRAPSKGGNTRWHCKCSCGKLIEICRSSLVKPARSSCGCKRHQAGNKHPGWKGQGDISLQWFNQRVTKRAADKKLDINIDIDYIWEVFLAQDRKCKLSGLELVFAKSSTDNYTNTTASLDRIDSTKGYVEGNVQWVHKDINMMKQSYDQYHFIKMCKLIAENN